MSDNILLYTEMLGLREVDHVPFLAPENAVIRVALDLNQPTCWHIGVRMQDHTGRHRGLEWKRISVDQLPKRLRMEALIMDIRL